MDETLLKTLLTDVKSVLRITWTDEDEDLKKLIQRSGTYLNEISGAPLDFSKEEQPKSLLLERCRYAYNNAAEEFEMNFHHELSRLILMVAIKEAGEHSEPAP